jgi:hypothetical protein
MKKFLLAGAAVLAMAASGALSMTGSAGAQSPSDSRVRVIHASPDAPDVDIYVNDEETLTNVPYKAVSDYLTVPAGSYNFKVFAAGANPASDEPVIDADASLAAGKDYSVAAVGLLADIAPAVFEDNNAAPAAGKAHVRVIHASPDAPAVDIAVADGPVVFSNLAFPDADGPTPVDAGTYDLEVLAAGTDTVALALDGVALQGGRIYTVIAMGLLEGDPALEAVTVVDEPRAAQPAPTPGAPAPAPTAEPNLPTTGTGDAGSGSSTIWFVAALAIAAVAAASAGLGLAFRRTNGS